MKKKQIDVSLVLPCYNEAKLFDESVKRIVSTLQNTKFTYEIIFVDDNSSDTTLSKIRKTPYRCIAHTGNLGRGRAVADGIRAAQGTVVGYIDIDCEVDPVYIPSMVSRILERRADVVIGKRYYRSSPKAMLREVLSRGYQWVSDVLIGTGGLDTETGYKFFSRKKILPVLSLATHPGWFWDTEIMVYARRRGLKIVEVPVLFIRRFDKQSSVRVFSDTIDYMRELIRFSRTSRQ